MLISVIVLQVLLFRSRWGLRTRAVGEHPKAAETVGIDVIGLRYRNVILGGVFAGLGGAYLTIEFGSAFQGEMTAGRGFIALAALIFGRWTPLGAFGAALLFTASNGLQRSIRFAPPEGALGDFLAAIPLAVLQRAAVPDHDHRAGGRGGTQPGAGSGRGGRTSGSRRRPDARRPRDQACAGASSGAIESVPGSTSGCGTGGTRSRSSDRPAAVMSRATDFLVVVDAAESDHQLGLGHVQHRVAGLRVALAATPDRAGGHEVGRPQHAVDRSGACARSRTCRRPRRSRYARSSATGGPPRGIRSA